MLPPDAKNVFKGLIFDIYQWEQTMFDGTKKIFEKAKRNDSVDVVAISPDGLIYIVTEEQPGRDMFYGLVGGTCEFGEEPLETAQRELLEETGLVSDDRNLFKSYSISSKIDQNSHIFIARNCKEIENQTLDPGGEKITYQKLTRKEFLDIMTNPKFRVGEFALDVFRYLYLNKVDEIKKIILNT